ncbi:hypothetical protein D3C84_815030 [compost metagenome]
MTAEGTQADRDFQGVTLAFGISQTSVETCIDLFAVGLFGERPDGKAVGLANGCLLVPGPDLGCQTQTLGGVFQCQTGAGLTRRGPGQLNGQALFRFGRCRTPLADTTIRRQIGQERRGRGRRVHQLGKRRRNAIKQGAEPQVERLFQRRAIGG